MLFFGGTLSFLDFYVSKVLQAISVTLSWSFKLRVEQIRQTGSDQ